MSFLIAFGLAGIMFCAGLIIRSKVTFFSKMLMPASVIAGVLGLIVMNTGLITAVNDEVYMNIVNVLFILVFISIGLTGSPKARDGFRGGNLLKGSLGIGLIFNILYAVMAIFGLIVIFGIGGFFGMDASYGMLITFGFGQGPGQAFTFGSIMEQQYGLVDAATVGITFASIGFLVCFIVGVPLARYGIKRGIAKNIGTNESQVLIERGYYKENEESLPLGKETMYSGNIDTLTFHFAIMGVCFLIGLGLANLVTLIPSVGPTLGSLVFFYCMIAAHFVKYVMRKLKVDYMLDNRFQSKVTGWATDYLVVTAFMAISFSVIAAWIVPILIEVVIITIIIFALSIYFARRLGADHDFERTLALFGVSTGTAPSGIALVRIVDPTLKTAAAMELGLANIPMMISQVTTALTILAIASGSLSLGIGILVLAAPIPIYLILLKVFKLWGSPTYNLKGEQVESSRCIQSVKREQAVERI